MCLLCTCAATYVTIWDVRFEVSTYYLELVPPGDTRHWTFGYTIKIFFQAFGTWILLFTNMVPISLLVSLEVVKFSQASFISWDIEIYDEEKDLPTKV